MPSASQPAGSGRVTLRPATSGDEAEFLDLVHINSITRGRFQCGSLRPVRFPGPLCRLAQQPAGPGTTHASFEHPWLGSVRRRGDDQLIAHISVPPAIRPARANGDTDAEWCRVARWVSRGSRWFRG